MDTEIPVTARKWKKKMQEKSKKVATKTEKPMGVFRSCGRKHFKLVAETKIWHKESFQIMKTVRTLPQYAETEVDFDIWV